MLFSSVALGLETREALVSHQGPHFQPVEKGSETVFFPFPVPRIIKEVEGGGKANKFADPVHCQTTDTTWQQEGRGKVVPHRKGGRRGRKTAL